MKISSNIGNDHIEQMNLILAFITNFDIHHLLFAISAHRFDEDDIQGITNDINYYNNNLNKQKNYLFKFGKTFNKEFTTDDNKCFDSSIKVSRKMRSGTAGVKKVLKRFVKVSRRPLGSDMPQPQAINHSYISSPHYIVDVFGLDSYPQCVKDLFQAMLDFYENIDECIHESKRILEEEKHIRDDRKKCLELLVNAFDKYKKQQIVFIEAIEQNPQLKEVACQDASLTSEKENPLLKAWHNKKDEGSFAQYFLHNCNPKDVMKITIANILESGLPPRRQKALLVFGNQKERISDIDYIIDNFDELLPEKCKGNQIPAMNILCFMEWCQPTKGIDSFLNYFNKYYKGKFLPIKRSALYGAHATKTRKPSKYVQKEKDFLKKLHELLEKRHSQK